MFHSFTVLDLHVIAGATYVVQPMFLFEYFGDEYLVEIVGIMMLVYGVSNLIGTPIAGT